MSERRDYEAAGPIHYAKKRTGRAKKAGRTLSAISR